MELRIKAADKKCMKYVLGNLDDLQEMARLRGVYKIVGKLSGLVTEVKVGKGYVEITCGRAYDR